MMKIAILGSTGSIGTQTLDIVREQGDIQVTAIAAGSLSLIHIFGYLFENFPFQTAMLFIGLIFGGVPLIWRKVSRGYPKVPELALFLGFFCLMIGMQFLGKGSEQVLAAGPGTAVKLFAVEMCIRDRFDIVLNC